MNIEVPDTFNDFEKYELWGVSPYSLLLANSYHQTRSATTESALRRVHDIEIIRTNYEVPWEKYLEFLTRICEAWFTGPIGDVAICVDQSTAKQFVVGAAYQEASGVMRGIRKGVDVFLETEDQEPVIVSPRDLKSVTDNADIRMLRSLGLIRRVPDGYAFDREILKTLRIGTEYSVSEAAWALIDRLCNHVDIENDAVIRPLLRTYDIPVPEKPPDSVKASLPLYLCRSDLSDFVTDLFSDELGVVLRDIKSSLAEKRNRIRNALQFGIDSKKPVTVNWPIGSDAAVICAFASQQDIPVFAEYLANQLNRDQYSIHTALRDAEIEVTLENESLHFDKAYSSPVEDTTPVKRYQNWLNDQLAELEAEEYAIDELSRRVTDGWRHQRQSLIEASLNQLDGFRVSPTTFVFSMLDPHYLDAYQVEKYVGDSELLNEEVRRIKDWRERKPHDADTFTNIISQVCHYPVSNNSVDQTLRIMSPWMNFAVQDYTSTFRHLIEQDVTIQLLFRLPSPKGWNNLKKHLLNRLGDTQGNLELRTYTRFKEFHDHPEIQNMVKNEDNYVGETGVHAKLFIAGDPEDGSMVAGSANLMENSFFYNPEAGIHTHDPNVLGTAIDYFDLIWELSEQDRIDESVFTGKTNFGFYPKVYRP